MKMSEAINELAAALCHAQAEIEAADKDGRGNYGRYTTLLSVWDACKPALTKHGLSVAQFAEPSEPGTLALTTMLVHKSGQFIAGTETLPLAKSDPQGYGSALTYARRYGLAAMVGVCPDDDDADTASARPAQTAQRQNAPAQTSGNGKCPNCHVTNAAPGMHHGPNCDRRRGEKVEA